MKALVKIHRHIAIAALALVPVLTASAATINASVYSVSGDAEFAPPGTSHFAPLQKGQTLPVGTTVRTGDNASRCW